MRTSNEIAPLFPFTFSTLFILTSFQKSFSFFSFLFALSFPLKTSSIPKTECESIYMKHLANNLNTFLILLVCLTYAPAAEWFPVLTQCHYLYSHCQKDARLKSLMAEDAKLRSHKLLTDILSLQNPVMLRYHACHECCIKQNRKNTGKMQKVHF